MSRFVELSTDWLMVASVRIGLLFVVLGLAAFALRSAGVRARAALWRAGLVLMAVLACLPVAWPPRGSIAVSSSPSSSWALPVLLRVGSVPATVAARPPVVAPDSVASSPEVLGARGAPAPFGWPWAHAIAMLWAGGALVQLARLCAGACGLARRIRASEPIEDEGARRTLARVRDALPSTGDVALRATSWPGAPAVCGWTRPVVLLPASWSTWPASRLEAVLSHELLHVAHRDRWFSRAAALLRAAFWFHPAVLYAARQTTRFQELCCDSAVVRSGMNALEYAEHLVHLARSKAGGRPAVCSLPFAQRSSLEERVRMLVSAADQQRGRRTVLVPVGALLLTTVASAWGVQAASRPDGSAQPARWQPAASSAERFLPLPADLQRLRLELTAHVRVRSTDAAPGLVVRARTARAAQAMADRLAIRSTGTACVVVDRSPATAAGLVVEVRLAQPVELDCTLSLGDLDCTAPLRSLRATTALGTLVFAAPAPVPGSIELSASNGSVAVHLPKLTGDLRAVCGRGNASVTLAGADSRGELLVAAGKGNATLRLPDAAAASFTVECPIGRITLPPGARARTGSGDLVCRLRASAGDVRVVALD